MAGKGSLRQHPPKVPLTIRVGVTGHRDVTDSEGLRGAVRQVLGLVRDFGSRLKGEEGTLYSSDEPVLRIISPLADGADRLVAEEALDLSFKLQCPFPFFQEEYEKDFKAEGSLEKFLELRAKAESVFELDGVRAPDEESLERDELPKCDESDTTQQAYEAVGHVVLRQSDLIIAVWDGAPERGKGGTGQVVREALKSEIPVIRIDPRAPHSVMVVRSVNPIAFGELTELCDRMRNIYAAPSSAVEHHGAPGKEFFEERQSRWSFAIFYRLLCKLLLWRTRWPIFRADFGAKTESQWKHTWADLERHCGHALAQGGVRKRVDEGFLRFFSWSDGLADVYGARYRSSFVMNYLMAASVVLVAFVGYFSELRRLGPGVIAEEIRLGQGWTLAELSLIVAIIVLTLLGRRSRWHERWMDYRWLAEGFRQMQLLAPLGRVMPAFRLPAHLDFGDPRRSWANWYVRGAVRHAGLIEAKMTAEHLAGCRKLMALVAGSQAGYHQKNARDSHQLAHNIQRLGFVLFMSALLGCLLHLADLELRFSHQPGREWARIVIGLLVLVAPAFGAAFAAISHQAEFERLAARSRALEVRLEALAGQLSDNGKPWTSRELGRGAEEFSRMLLGELADWRYVFLDKQLVLPT